MLRVLRLAAGRASCGRAGRPALWRAAAQSRLSSALDRDAGAAPPDALPAAGGAPPDALPAIADAAEFARVAGGPASAILFTARWSGPCRLLAPVLVRAADEHNARVPAGAARVCLAAVDIDALGPLAVQHGVTSVPHVVLFRGGRAAASFSGVRAADYVSSFLQSH